MPTRPSLIPSKQKTWHPGLDRAVRGEAADPRVFAVNPVHEVMMIYETAALIGGYTIEDPGTLGVQGSQVFGEFASAS